MNFKEWNRVSLLILSALAVWAVACTEHASPVPKPPPPPFEYVQTWGQKGEGAGLLGAPVAFAVDTQGRVYFADSGSGYVHKFEATGVPLLSFEDFHVKHAAGIAVDSGGAIYLADGIHGDILIYFPDGTLLRTERFAPQPHLIVAIGIDIDDAGNLYIPDATHSRVTEFDARGRLARSWGVPHSPAAAEERPSFIAISPDGSIFVAFAKTGRIEKYSSDGSFVTTWGVADQTPPDSTVMSAIAVAGNYIFALVSATPRLRVWNLDGQHKLDDNLGGHLDGVNAPQLGMTPHGDLLVYDPETPRVMRFRVHF
jgi:tripartite motif-containing protein 71